MKRYKVEDLPPIGAMVEAKYSSRGGIVLVKGMRVECDAEDDEYLTLQTYARIDGRVRRGPRRSIHISRLRSVEVKP